MSFETLPVELKAMIFSHFSTSELLSTIAPVSVHWKNIALHPFLWRNVDFNGDDYDKLPDDIVDHLKRSCLAKRVAFKSFRDFNWLKPRGIYQQIRKLKFEDCHIKPKDLLILIYCCPNVESFCLKQAGLEVTKFFRGFTSFSYDVNLRMISKITEWRNMKSIKITYTDCISEHDDCLAAIAKQCKLIEKISLRNFCQLTEVPFKKLIELRGPQLKVLELSTPDLLSDDYKLLERCVNMKKLTLDEANKMTVEDFVGLTKLPNLKRLKCYNYHYNSKEQNFLEDVSDFQFNQLEEIEFDNINWTMEIVDKHFPQLKIINDLPVAKFLLAKDEKYNHVCY